jgi:glycosyltransferase involved in cell wall biosynthesis
VHPALLDAPAVPKQVRRVVTAGAFDPLKRMDGVLETFARIQKRWPDAELLVFGDGPLRRGLEAQARALRLQRVEFRGFVPQRDLFAEMQRAEVFLFLSCAERLANAIKEAIAARCYCVVGRTVGVEELIPGPDHGRIVADGAWDEAAEYVSQAFADPARRVETTERAIAHLRMHFDVNASMAQYRAVWSAFQA